jgi:2,3-bisphosphoglycerate-dependent phosphoglycerate mutase
MEEDRIYITFMRHGWSQADDEEVHEGRYDSPLTDKGRDQARARGEAWAAINVKFDTIITSALSRAKETAEIIGEIVGSPVEEDPDWMEMDNGPLAGLPRKEAEEKYPRPSFRNPFEPFWETGESNWAIYRRASSAVERIIRRGPGRYLVVAHGGILNSAMRLVVGVQPMVNRQGIIFAFGDVGYAYTAYFPDTHQWVLLGFHEGM